MRHNNTTTSRRGSRQRGFWKGLFSFMGSLFSIRSKFDPRPFPAVSFLDPHAVSRHWLLSKIALLLSHAVCAFSRPFCFFVFWRRPRVAFHDHPLFVKEDRLSASLRALFGRYRAKLESDEGFYLRRRLFASLTSLLKLRCVLWLPFWGWLLIDDPLGWTTQGNILTRKIWRLQHQPQHVRWLMPELNKNNGWKESCYIQERPHSFQPLFWRGPTYLRSSIPILLSHPNTDFGWEIKVLRTHVHMYPMNSPMASEV